MSASTTSAPRGCALDGVEYHRPRVSAFVAPDHRGADSLAPQSELVGGRRPEGVPCREDHVPALLTMTEPELADRGRLPHPVDAHEQPHIGDIGFDMQPPVAVQLGHQVGTQRVEQ